MDLSKMHGLLGIEKLAWEDSEGAADALGRGTNRIEREVHLNGEEVSSEGE